MTRENSKRFYDIMLDYDRLVYPNLPDHTRAITIYPDVNEKGVKKNLKQWCKAMGFKYTNTDSKAVASVKFETLKHASGQDRQHMTMHYRKSELDRGHHDCEISKNNRLWSLEIKAQNKKKNYKDRQSDEQKDFERTLKDKYGNDYHIITGMDSFFELYDNEISKAI